MIADKLSKEHSLPEERESELKFHPIAPWTTLETPTIKTTLIDENVNKNTDHHTLKACALETIHDYPTSLVHTYTDGSASNGTKTAGFGVHLRFPDGRTLDHSDACGKICSNFEAEVMALTCAIELTGQYANCEGSQVNNLVVFY